MKKSLVRKLVLGILIVSLTTYGTSALFIFKLKDWLVPAMKDSLYYSIVLALGIFWTCLLGWVAARFVVKPLLKLTAVVDTIASGNLTVDIPEHRSQDEIGRLYQSFQIMLDNLRQMITGVSDNVAITDQSINTLSAALKQATSQIETIASNIDEMAEGAAKQASSAEQMLYTTEQVTESAAGINSGAGRALQISDTMVQTITSSAAQIRTLVNGMQHISETSEKTLEIVALLEHQADEISQISQLVQNIADQTHLLALNASIEAAHAGEMGKGFAVVADHIRKLAGDSAAAGNQINTLVSEMQKQTITVVKETSKQVELIRHETTVGEEAQNGLDNAINAVNETAEALKSIAAHIRSQSDQINDIFKQAQQIASTAAAISDGGINIATAIQEQTAVMQEITSSSELLRDEANSLKQKTIMFKI